MVRKSLSPRKRMANRPNRRETSTQTRARQVLEDMLSDPSFTLTQAARKRGTDPRSVRKHLPTDFRKDASGRVRAKPKKPRHKTLYIPSDSPGIPVPVVTRNRRERLLLGEWMAALNAAGRGNFSRMRKFPKRQVIRGVRLATGPKEVQRILNAQAEEESPFEGLYRTLVRPS